MKTTSYADIKGKTVALQVAPGTIELGAEFDQHRVTGYSNIGGHRIDCPLITHVEGNLYQGGCASIILPDDFMHVVSLFPWGKYYLGPLTSRVEYMLYDSVDQDTTQVEEIVSAAVSRVDQGPTLIHCQAGLNRSGLIAGRVLMEAFDYTADDAIKKLRERSPAVLCNPTFEAYLRGL